MNSTVVFFSALLLAFLGTSGARSLSDYELRTILEQFNNDFAPSETMEPLQKRTYQHIWRNLQMQMPIYAGTGQRDSKRANELNRARSNNLYRLG